MALLVKGKVILQKKTWIEKAQEIRNRTKSLIMYDFSKNEPTPSIDTMTIKRNAKNIKPKEKEKQHKNRSIVRIVVVGVIVAGGMIVIYSLRKIVLKKSHG